MKKILSIAILFFIFGNFLFAQKGYLTNNGGWICISNGTYVTASTYVNKTAASDGKIILDGTMIITGDFINESTNETGNVFTDTVSGSGYENGEIIFAKNGTQYIKNTTPNAYINFEKVSVADTSNTLVNAGSAATINGILNVSGVFRLSSPTDGESPSGSLITNTSAAGNVTGTGALWVDRHFETNGRYQYIGIPVDNATDDLFDNSGNSHPFNSNLYSYDETFDATVDPPNTDYTNWSDPTYALYDAWTSVAVNGSSVILDNEGTGYITYNEVELDVNFGGSPSNLNNAASYVPTVTYTFNDDADPGAGTNDYFDGWNIIANPYPCALDFSALSLSNINNCLYMWDGDNGNYLYFQNGGTTYDDGSNVLSGATKYIPAMQSFAVKATSSGSPGVIISEGARVHNVQVMYKSQDAPVYGQTQFIKLSTSDGDFKDEMIVRYLNEAQENFDNEYDAYKMFPNDPPVMIYSLITNPEIPIAINSLPVEDIGVSVPLGFIASVPGTYTIKAENFVFDAGTDVKLIDTYDNKEVAMYEGAEYTFSAESGEVRDRFYLFSGPTGIDNPGDSNNNVFDSNVWSSDHKIYIVIKSNKMIDANVKVYDVLGKTVIDQNVNGTYNILDVPGSSGTYFIKLTGTNGISQTKKVFIQK